MISDTKEPLRLLKRSAVLEIVPMCGAQLYTLMREGRFPRPVRLGGTAVAWLQSEVDRWVAERIAERDGRAAEGAPVGEAAETDGAAAEPQGTLRHA